MKPLLRFIFPRSLGRIEYTIRLFVCIFAASLGYYFRDLTDPAANLLALLIWNYIAFFVILPRARQCGMSFLYAIFALVPLIFPFLALTLMFRSPEYEFRRTSEQSTVQT